MVEVAQNKLYYATKSCDEPKQPWPQMCIFYMSINPGLKCAQSMQSHMQSSSFSDQARHVRNDVSALPDTRDKLSRV